jgi:NTP pyrophosphatase (non-canonical NTP hydrolase)
MNVTDDEIMTQWKQVSNRIGTDLSQDALDLAHWLLAKSSAPNNLNIRLEVIEFANDMEINLKANDHKDGWDACTFLWLMTKLSEEVGELGVCCLNNHNLAGQYIGYVSQHEEVQALRRVIREAADVANIAMMIADRARKIIAEGA